MVDDKKQWSNVVIGPWESKQAPKGGKTRDQVIQEEMDAIDELSQKAMISLIQILKENDVDIVTLGQYLQPSKKHLPVKNYIEPTQFKVFESFAKDLGFRHVESSALVRSSYKAQKHIL